MRLIIVGDQRAEDREATLIGADAVREICVNDTFRGSFTVQGLLQVVPDGEALVASYGAGLWIFGVRSHAGGHVLVAEPRDLLNDRDFFAFSVHDFQRLVNPSVLGSENS